MTIQNAAAKPKTLVIGRTAELGAAKPAAPLREQVNASHSRQLSKSANVLRLLQRKRGATIAELQKATGWQAHSVRGFLSATVKKRMALDVFSEKGTDGLRRYIIAKS